MAKLTLNTISSGFQSNDLLNTNFDDIETAIENTLSRDGTSPNTMSAQLDMNSNQIINLAAPTTANAAARKTDVDAVVAAGLPTQTTHSGKYLKTDGTAASWDALDISTADITGTLPFANGGTGATSAPAVRTALSLVPGTDVQVYDADLTTLGGLAKTDSNFIVGDGTTWVVESGATVRTSLGLGTAALVNTGVTTGNVPTVDQTLNATTRAATTTLGTSLNHTLSDTSTTITAFNGVSGVTYHCRCLGAGAITHHATDLIITQTGASIAATAAGDTFDIEMITGTTCRLKNFTKADGTAVVASAGIGDHCVTVHTGNGHGSTKTKYRRFTTAMTNTGTAITYADSAADGNSFTINEAGDYEIFTADRISAGNCIYGFSVNDSSGGLTSIHQLTVAQRGAFIIWTTAGYESCISRVVRLAVNDIVHAHTDGNPNFTGDSTYFSIRKVSNG